MDSVDSAICLFFSILTISIIIFVYPAIHDLWIWLKEKRAKKRRKMKNPEIKGWIMFFVAMIILNTDYFFCLWTIALGIEVEDIPLIIGILCGTALGFGVISMEIYFMKIFSNRSKTKS